MLKFVDFLKKENIIESIKQYYKNNFNDNPEGNFLNEIFENFNSIRKKEGYKKKGELFNEEYSDYDIISSLYESNLDHVKRKKLGEFYTPISVVSYILDAIGYSSLVKIENKKIIDISCGSGSFLIQVVRILKKRCLDIYGKREISELTTKEAKCIISRIKNNIYGKDINQIACILCQINIYFEVFEIIEKIRKGDSSYHLPKFNIENRNALTMDHEKKYDFVVGNPPYIFIRDIPDDQKQIIQNRDYKTNKGQYDLYQIFIEIGLKILKSHGILGYIVPDSLLALTNRSIIRKYIYNNSKIKEIYHTGPRFNNPVVSNIIIVLEKESNLKERNKNQITIKRLPEQDKRIPQEILEKWNYKFLVHLNTKDISILDYLTQNFTTIKDLNKKKEFKISLGRGVELTKTGKVIYCEICKKYFPIPKDMLKCRECNSILNEKRTENIIYENIPKDSLKSKYKLYLYSFQRYQKTQYKYIDTSKIGINYKKLSLYENRIVIRQLNQKNMICATYEKNLSLTSQSNYNLKIKKSPNSEFNHFYLLGIINSTLISYFFIKSFGSYKKLFPRVLIEKIKDFPVKIPITDKEKQKAKKIIEKVKIILDDFKKMDSLQKMVDNLVFDLYEIIETDRNHILNYMNNINL